MKWRALLLTVFLGRAVIAAPEFDVHAFGAVGDGKTSDTAAIQKAIDTCSGQGGGIVRFGAGQFVSGTILLKDHVTLWLETNTTLLGSLEISDYQNPDPFTSGNGAALGYCFIAVVDARDVRIEGGGTIDGRGKELLAARPKGNNARPFLMRVVRSDHVSLHRLQLKNSAAWTLHFSQSRQIEAFGLTVASRGLGNNDGIDIDSCQGVEIGKCDIDTGDDAICLKTTSTNACRDIRVRDCTLKSHWAAVKFGTESAGNFEDIEIANCAIRDTEGGGIKLCSVDGSHVRHVTISDLTMDNVTLPVFIRLGARLKTFRDGEPKQPVGSIDGVVIRNLKATATWPVGIVISGIPGHPIHNIAFSNITMHLPGGGTTNDPVMKLEEKESAYPEINIFGKKFPAYGVFARHIDGMVMDRVVVELAAADERPAIAGEDVSDLKFYDWQLPAGPGGKWTAQLDSVRKAVFGGPSPWQVNGTNNQEIEIMSKAAQP